MPQRTEPARQPQSRACGAAGSVPARKVTAGAAGQHVGQRAPGRARRHRDQPPPPQRRCRPPSIEMPRAVARPAAEGAAPSPAAPQPDRPAGIGEDRRHHRPAPPVAAVGGAERNVDRRQTRSRPSASLRATAPVSAGTLEAPLIRPRRPPRAPRSSASMPTTKSRRVGEIEIVYSGRDARLRDFDNRLP